MNETLTLYEASRNVLWLSIDKATKVSLIPCSLSQALQISKSCSKRRVLNISSVKVQQLFKLISSTAVVTC